MLGRVNCGDAMQSKVGMSHGITYTLSDHVKHYGIVLILVNSSFYLLQVSLMSDF